MTRVFVRFATIGFILTVRYRGGPLGVLGASAGFVPNRIVFFVLSPCLFFTVLVLRYAGSSPCRFFTVLVLDRACSSPRLFFTAPESVKVSV